MNANDTKHVLAIDLGTGGPKVAIVSNLGEIIAHTHRDSPPRLLPGGAAEHDPDEWWACIVDACRQVLAESAVSRDSVVAIGVSSQWSLTVPVDRSGRHLMNCIGWMDTRGAKYCHKLNEGLIKVEGYNVFRLMRWIRLCAGAPTHTGADSLAHILFIKHERPDIYRETFKFLEPMDYINLRLTGRIGTGAGNIITYWATDVRDINRVQYDRGLLALAGLDETKLPELLRPNSVLGTLTPEAAEELGLPESVNVALGCGDNHSAVIGSGAVRDFEGHCYVGTTSWISCHLPFKKTDIFHQMTTLPAAIPGCYFLLAQQGTGGECLKFLRENILGGGPVHGNAAGPSFDELIHSARAVPPGSDGLLFTPWLTGAMTPAEDRFTRSAFFNQSLKTTRAHYVRAVMEGVAFNLRWLLPYTERFIGRPFPALNFIGGGAQSDLWCQIVADVLNRPIRQVEDPRQAGPRGVAFLAFMALGLLKLEDVPDRVRIARTYEPNPDHRALYDEAFHGFGSFYRKNKPIYARLNRRR